MDELALHHGATTPKRKRPDVHAELPPEESANPQFSFRSGDDDGMDGDSASPRSKMAHKFRGLALESGGGVPAAAAATATGANGTGLPASSAPPAESLATAGPTAINKNNTTSANTTSANNVAAQLGEFGFDPSSKDIDDINDINDGDVDEPAMRKRQKIPRSASDAEISANGAPTADADEANTQVASEQTTPSTSPAPVPVVDIPNIATKQAANRRPSLQRSLPSINRLTTSKARSLGQNLTPTPPEETPTELENANAKSRRNKKRSSTPPLKTRSKPAGISPPSSPEDSAEEDDDEEAYRIIDPLRASLTWHEDEITVYDPEDPEDDGLGIEGIGFKPSQLVAEARAAKRRQQLLEYRRREESEARDRRSQRRRAAAAAAAAAAATMTPVQAVSMMTSGDEARKVRFMDVEPTCVAMTG